MTVVMMIDADASRHRKALENICRHSHGGRMRDPKQKFMCFCANRYGWAVNMSKIGVGHVSLCVCVCKCVCKCTSTVTVERQTAVGDAQGTSQKGAVVTKGKPVSLIPIITLQNSTLREGRSLLTQTTITY